MKLNNPPALSEHYTQYVRQQLFVCRCAPGNNTASCVLFLTCGLIINYTHKKFSVTFETHLQSNACILGVSDSRSVYLCRRWCSVGTAVHVTSRSFCVPHLTFQGLFLFFTTNNITFALMWVTKQSFVSLLLMKTKFEESNFAFLFL